DVEKAILKKSKTDEDESFIGNQRNLTEIETTYNERDKSLNDFYTSYDEFKVTAADKAQYKKFMEGYSDKQKDAIKANYNFYEITFTNVGGLVMPIILEFEYKDGTKEKVQIPAEIWKMTSEGGANQSVTKVFIKKKEVANIVLDPNLETADCDLNNNYWPNRVLPTRFKLYQDKKKSSAPNPMQKAKK
ncbi:MAG: M1 family peptidase, partial [Flavobacteriales bacterium]